jgi:hypothetical protein
MTPVTVLITVAVVGVLTWAIGTWAGRRPS